MNLKYKKFYILILFLFAFFNNNPAISSTDLNDELHPSCKNGNNITEGNFIEILPKDVWLEMSQYFSSQQTINIGLLSKTAYKIFEEKLIALKKKRQYVIKLNNSMDTTSKVDDLLNYFKPLSSPDAFDEMEFVVGEISEKNKDNYLKKIKKLFNEKYYECLKLMKEGPCTKIEKNYANLKLLPCIGSNNADLKDYSIYLNTIRLSYNKLYSLPRQFSQLKSLQFLDLGVNKFQVFPEVICELENLSALYLDSNKLRYIPVSISKSRNLTTLNLNSNSFNTFALELCSLDNLENLVLAGNKFDVVPRQITQLTKLGTLDLSYNLLTQLPDLSQLINLLELNLKNNKITDISTSFIDLKNLRRLYLESNQLEVFPEVISKLTQLEVLKIADNPFKQPFLNSIKNLLNLTQKDF